MKRIFWISALCVAFVTVMPVIAQNEDGSPYYYVNVPIERIYPYRKGYVVDYQVASTARLDRIFIPLEWFKDGLRGEGEDKIAPRGEVILLSPGNSWPYMTVYYKEGGEFSHVRLYIRRERAHVSWGGIPGGVNLDANFEDIDSLELKF